MNKFIYNSRIINDFERYFFDMQYDVEELDS